MPELPDVSIYREALERRVLGATLRRVAIASPFLLRTFDPPIDAAEGRPVRAVERLGKRILLALEGDLFLVIHLMIAGRLRWSDADAAPAGVGRIGLAELEFDTGSLWITEAGKQKRASLHLIAGRESLRQLDRGGLDVLSCSAAEFTTALRRENHTLKRALTDPTLFDGIGNAYSDEILHAARLSPLLLTSRIGDDDAARLHAAAKGTLADWTERLRAEFGLDSGPGRFPGPGEITAFRPDFAVHGKFGKPCPVCGKPVQRIVYADNETNYCAQCQTGGKVLADRGLSRLLKDDWPRSIDELE